MSHPPVCMTGVCARWRTTPASNRVDLPHVMGRSNHYALFHGITLTLTDNAFHPQNKADIANKMFADPSFEGDYRTSMIFRDFWVTLENDKIYLHNQYDIRDGIILDSRLKDTLKFAFLFRLSRQNHRWLFEYQIIMG